MTDRETIMGWIKMLAQSQGAYGRLLADLESLDDERREEVLAQWEKRNFKDAVDFVMYIEG